ncbi:MAG TPA: hypothetical protein DD766_00710 [Desulfovibrio sp.]|mgnify:FL=1|jgi:hypothetical protein|nr:hypothetical protein [Desulfovibrio sp.]
MTTGEGPRGDCDRCRHSTLCKGCPFLQLAANLNSPVVNEIRRNYCETPEAATQCVRRLALQYYDLLLPADIMPDGRSCFENGD